MRFTATICPCSSSARGTPSQTAPAQCSCPVAVFPKNKKSDTTPPITARKKTHEMRRRLPLLAHHKAHAHRAPICAFTRLPPIPRSRAQINHTLKPRPQRRPPPELIVGARPRSARGALDIALEAPARRARPVRVQPRRRCGARRGRRRLARRTGERDGHGRRAQTHRTRRLPIRAGRRALSSTTRPTHARRVPSPLRTAPPQRDAHRRRRQPAIRARRAREEARRTGAPR